MTGAGKRYDGGEGLLRGEDFAAYAAATDDPNPAYRGPAPVAPPMFHVAPLRPLLHTLATDPELGLDYLRLVHGEHGMTFHRLLRPGDRLRTSAELASLEDKPSGRVASFTLRGEVDGQAVFTGSTTFFIRAPAAPGAAPAKKAGEPELDPGPAQLEVDQPVAADQAVRYAAASGDRNPIHLDPDVARAAGLPGPILHGLCTLAFAQRDLVAGACAGDPARLASLAVRWVKPVALGDTLRMSAWAHPVVGGMRPWSFVTRDGQGQLVLARGRATVRP